VGTRRSTRDTTDAVEALRLLGAWTRLAQGHVALGSGCSCGGGLGSMPVAEFERDIVDYLRGKHPAFATQLDASAQPIAALLRELARPSTAHARTTGAQHALLSDLSRTIESFERVHAGA
jgi:hypothetical protein